MHNAKFVEKRRADFALLHNKNTEKQDKTITNSKFCHKKYKKEFVCC